MKISRRDFVHAGCMLGAASLLNKSWAGINNPGSSGGSQKIGQSVVNIGSSNLGFINLAHGALPTSSQTNFPNALTADGYPTSSITSDVTCNFNLDITYYGRYLIWWTGTGAFSCAFPAIIYNGGSAALGVGNNSGSTAANTGFGLNINGLTQPTQASPCEFSFGALVASVSGGNGSLVTITTSQSLNFGSGLGTGSVIKLQNGVSANLANGPNPDGSWTITNIDGTHFTLNNSSGVVSPTVTGAGGPGVQTEAILNGANFSGSFSYTFGTYSGFSNMVFCKKSDQAAVLAGQLASPIYVSQIKALNPRFARLMDYSGVQNDRSSAFSNRTQISNLSWGSPGHLVPGYYVGAITNGGTDNYTCSNPSLSPSTGPPVDGEVVIGQLSAANTGVAPTLAISRTGFGSAKPILSPDVNAGASQINLFLTGSVPVAGKVVTCNFSGAGLVGTYSPTYTVLSSDTTLTILGNSLQTKFRADATLLAAGVIVPFNGTVIGSAFSLQFNPNIGGLGASNLTLTASDNGTPGAAYATGTTDIGSLQSNAYCSFYYSALIGGWFCLQGSPGIHGGFPLEWAADLCNRAGVGLWLNIGVMWSAARITSTVQALANLGVKELTIECGNETWNSFEAEWAAWTTMGCCLGLNNATNPVSSANGFTGLRTLQVAQLAVTAWTGAGRSRSQLFIELAYQFVDMNTSGTTDTCVNRMKGANLNTSTNATLAALGGMGQTALSFNPSTSGNRPIDNADAIGGAPYWCGAQFNVNNGGFFLDTGVPLAAYNGSLLAAYNYAYGTPTQQQAALDFLYNVSGNSGDLYNGQLNGSTNFVNQLASFELGSGQQTAGYSGVGTFIASFDSFRSGAGLSILGCFAYEGFHDSGPTVGAETTGAANSLIALGYTNGYSSSLPGAASGGPTGSSDTPALAATNLTALLAAFKFDTRFATLSNKYFTAFQAAARSGGNRIALPATFGFEGPNVWALYPGFIGSVPTPYQGVNALQSFNN